MLSFFCYFALSFCSLCYLLLSVMCLFLSSLIFLFHSLPILINSLPSVSLSIFYLNLLSFLITDAPSVIGLIRFYSFSYLFLLFVMTSYLFQPLSYLSLSDLDRFYHISSFLFHSLPLSAFSQFCYLLLPSLFHLLSFLINCIPSVIMLIRLY